MQRKIIYSNEKSAQDEIKARRFPLYLTHAITATTESGLPSKDEVSVPDTLVVGIFHERGRLIFPNKIATDVMLDIPEEYRDAAAPAFAEVTFNVVSSAIEALLYKNVSDENGNITRVPALTTLCMVGDINLSHGGSYYFEWLCDNSLQAKFPDVRIVKHLVSGDKPVIDHAEEFFGMYKEQDSHLNFMVKEKFTPKALRAEAHQVKKEPFRELPSKEVTKLSSGHDSSPSTPEDGSPVSPKLSVSIKSPSMHRLFHKMTIHEHEEDKQKGMEIQPSVTTSTKRQQK